MSRVNRFENKYGVLHTWAMAQIFWNPIPSPEDMIVRIKKHDFKPIGGYLKEVEVQVQVQKKVPIESYKLLLVVFLSNFCHEKKRTPTLEEWISFYKETPGVPEETIKKRIAFFEKQQADAEKLNLEFIKIFGRI